MPQQSYDLAAKIVMMENLLFIVDKEARLRLLKLNMAQHLLFANWTHLMLLCKSRQEGISTAILGLFFIEAQIIPGLTVAVVSHEDFATRRLLDKLDIFHKHLPENMKSRMFHDSDNEKAFENGSTIYIGTAGQRAFGRGDTVHRALVSEEAHYGNAEKLLSGLAEAVPITGYLIRESTPLGDSGHYYNSVQKCIENGSNFKLVPFYWWLCQDYQIPRGSEIVLVEDRFELQYSPRELELVLEKGLTEEQIRWRRWKIRSMESEAQGNFFPQEYIEDLESCWLGPQDKVFQDVDQELQSWALRTRDPIRVEGIVEVWKDPIPGQRYVFWVDPAGGEGTSESDPHDGVILRQHPGGLEHVASIRSQMDQRSLAYKMAEIATRYNGALLIIERNGVGQGVLNYLVNDIGYKNLYPERASNGELTGKWGWYTSHSNKANMISEAKAAIKNGSVVSYDKKLVSQVRNLVLKNGKIQAKTGHDDRAMAFCGAVTISQSNFGLGGASLAVGDYVNWRR